MSGPAEQLSRARDLLEAANAFLADDKYLQVAESTAEVVNMLPELQANHIAEELKDIQRTLLEIQGASSKIAEEVQRAHAELDPSAEGWERMRDYDGISTLYKKEEGTDFHTLRVEGNVNAPLFNILAVFYEIDLFKLWLPTYQMLGLKESSVIGKISKTKLLADFKMNMPWPITNRDCVLSVTGVDCMDRKDDGTNPQIVCMLESRGGGEDTYNGQPVSAETDGFVRCDIIRGCVVLTPAETRSAAADDTAAAEGEGAAAGGAGTFVQIMCSVDPKLTMVPVWLINMVMRNFAFLILVQLRTTATTVQGTVYEQRIQKNREFYGFVERRMAECLPEEAKRAKMAAAEKGEAAGDSAASTVQAAEAPQPPTGEAGRA
jgi:hypothetical protein